MKLFKIVAVNEPEVFKRDEDDKRGVFYVMEETEEAAIGKFQKAYSHWKDGIRCVQERRPQGVITSRIWVP